MLKEKDTELVTMDNLDYTAAGPDHSLAVETGCNLAAEAGMEPGCNLLVETGCNSPGVGGCKLLTEAACNSLGVGDCKLLMEAGCNLPADSGRNLPLEVGCNLPLALVEWSTRTVAEVLVESRQS